MKAFCFDPFLCLIRYSDTCSVVVLKVSRRNQLILQALHHFAVYLLRGGHLPPLQRLARVLLRNFSVLTAGRTVLACMVRTCFLR